jgi:hypothetical protein
MPRFKPVHKGLTRLPVDFERPSIPGSDEHALSSQVDHKLEVSALERCDLNDFQGATAYAPAVLLKIILLAYSRGIVGSRTIEAAFGVRDCWRPPAGPPRKRGRQAHRLLRNGFFYRLVRRARLK